MDSYGYVFKFVMNGSSGVGKSSLLLQFINHKFDPQYEPTYGIEFGSKILNIRQKNIKLQIWDKVIKIIIKPGLEPFNSLNRSYHRGAICALIVYDVTSRSSFEYCGRRVQEIRSYSNEQIILVLVANKIDLPDRVISIGEGEQLAKENNLLQFEASAKLNVDNIFTHVAGIVLEKIETGEINIDDITIGIKYGPLFQKSEAAPTQRYSNCF